ncbi:MAG: tRNA1(Val) (adenine(37)-N6)-methyltransferase [Bacilli bacterium]|nr:tRNA1(Val) (adenine(37)-N6)-methyltransferase [Bacilli bacterium]
MKKLNDLLGYKHRKIYQDDKCFSFCLDSVLLANFIDIKKKDTNILDIGTGNGVIPLILSLKTSNKIVGVEIQKKLSNLAIESVKYNRLENQIDIINQDIKKFSVDKNNYYDIIACNPPYFVEKDNSKTKESVEEVIARHEIKINLEEILKLSKKMLKNNGRLYLIHRVERFVEVVDLYKKYNIEPKRVRFIHNDKNSSAKLFLIEGTKNGNVGLKIDKPLIMFNEGVETEEYLKIIEGE